MNNCVVTGRVARDAKIDGKSLVCFVRERRRGFGQASDRVFSQTVKVVMFGRDLDQMLAQLKEGVFVEACGEASAEVYMKGDEPRAILKIVGKVAPMEMNEAPATAPQASRNGHGRPAPRTAPSEPPLPAPEDEGSVIY